MRSGHWHFAHWASAILLASGFVIGFVRGVFSDFRAVDSAFAGLLMGLALAGSVYSLLVSAELVGRVFGQEPTNIALAAVLISWLVLGGLVAAIAYWIADGLDVLYAMPGLGE